MKPFELTYLAAQPFLPPLHGLVRRRLLRLAAAGHRSFLDVGGRKSHYTIGVPEVTVTDLPRDTELQAQLDLGIDESISQQTRRRRSNVKAVLYDDMTDSWLADDSYDVVVAVEVLEHVAEDEQFVAEVARVLRPGGVFLMTTPNGDYVENHNPDHKRHYRRIELRRLLERHFAQADVRYAIPGGRWRKLGLRSWSVRRPLRTLLSMTGNVVNRVQSVRPGTADRAEGTFHLIAEAAL